jgi:hypothetical protein
MCCPNCGSSTCTSNLIDEKPFREIAEEAWMLRQTGRTDRAADALTRLAGVQIKNFIRPHWLCLECGVKYDE